MLSTGGNGFDIEVVALLPVHLVVVNSYWGLVDLKSRMALMNVSAQDTWGQGDRGGGVVR